MQQVKSTGQGDAKSAELPEVVPLGQPFVIPYRHPLPESSRAAFFALMGTANNQNDKAARWGRSGNAKSMQSAITREAPNTPKSTESDVTSQSSLNNRRNAANGQQWSPQPAPSKPGHGHNGRAAVLPKKAPKLFRYQPRAGDEDVYRTVMLTGVSALTRMCDLMSCVAGGVIYSAQLLNTMLICGTVTARVIFVSQASAKQFIHASHAVPIELHGHVIKTTLLGVPTWPLSVTERAQITRERETRCLVIRNAPPEVTVNTLHDVLQQNMITTQHWLETISVSQGTFTITMQSIRIARQAYLVLANCSWMKDVSLEFGRDPCDQPVCEFLAAKFLAAVAAVPIVLKPETPAPRVATTTASEHVGGPQEGQSRRSWLDKLDTPSNSADEEDLMVFSDDDEEEDAMEGARAGELIDFADVGA